MSEEYNATQKPVMRSEISRYAYGGFGVNIVSSLFASFAVYFMTDVAGLNVAVAGIVSGVALFFDAVTDVLLGAICDKNGSLPPVYSLRMFGFDPGRLDLFYDGTVCRGRKSTVLYLRILPV